VLLKIQTGLYYYFSIKVSSAFKYSTLAQKRGNIMCNVTLRCIHKTIVAVEKEEVLHISVHSTIFTPTNA
jgi:hypothetical protein